MCETGINKAKVIHQGNSTPMSNSDKLELALNLVNEVICDLVVNGYYDASSSLLPLSRDMFNLREYLVKSEENGTRVARLKGK